MDRLGHTITALAHKLQTLFVGYFILDQLLAGKLSMAMPLLLQLLGLKLLLSSFSLGSGLTGGGTYHFAVTPSDLN